MPIPVPVPVPEYRRCPVTGRWVIIAPERSLRPYTLPHASPHRRDADGRRECPFCPGREHLTTLESYAVRPSGSAPNTPGWTMRVIPNKYPAVRPMPDAPSHSVATDGFHEAVAGFGLHEVVVQTDRHETDPTRLSDEEFRDVLVAFRERLRVHAANPDYAYATVFQNVGAEAGASLAHLHAQILATPIVPEGIRHEMDSATEFYRRTRRCVFCELIRRERADRVRVVVDPGGFVAVCPYAPRFGFETWVLPARHDSRYEVTTDADLLDLARLLRKVLAAIDQVLNAPAYNYFLHASPLRSANLPDYHWHLEIVPRVARAAGFEWASDCFINATAPETAAADLRSAIAGVR